MLVFQSRQGDVFIKTVDHSQLDGAGEVPRDSGRIVLAYGEVTGHAHAIASPSARLLQSGSRRFLAVAETVELRHEEHATVVIPPGSYEVIQQKEYAPSAIRNVAD